MAEQRLQTATLSSHHCLVTRERVPRIMQTEVFNSCSLHDATERH
jgi:hypothetical protein